MPLLEHTGGPVALPFAPKAAISKEENRWLAELGAHLIAPVQDSDGQLAGMLMLGEKKSEAPYNASDRRLLGAIAKQMAVVTENLRNFLKECPSCGACFDSPAETCDRDGQPLSLLLPVVRTIDGKYRLDQLIGKGGMGAVYEARDLRLERSVAVKVMVGRAFGDESALRRFRREARAAARLNHPNIVSVYDFGGLDGGDAYLVMERIHGVTLRAELGRLGVLPPPLAAEWFE